MGATEVVWPASDKAQGRKSRKKDAELWGFEFSEPSFVTTCVLHLATRASRSVSGYMV